MAAGIIRKSKSQWSSPEVMVREFDGTFCFCIDYRGVNKVTRVSAYPIPYTDAILRKLQQGHCKSTVDFSSAEHQIPLAEEAKHLTAFTVPSLGVFEFNRLLYRVAGEPAFFQELSDQLIYPEHVLHRIAAAGLMINREKSKFCCSKVKFLGLLMIRSEFYPNPEKIAPIIR